MSGKSKFSSSALAVLAVAIAATAVPSTSFAQDAERGGRGGREWSSQREARGNRPDQARGNEMRSDRVRAETRRSWTGGERAADRSERPAGPAWQSNGNAEARARWGAEDRSPSPESAARRSVQAPSQGDRSARQQQSQRGWDGNRWNGTAVRQEQHRDRDYRENRQQAGRERTDRQRNDRNRRYSDGDRNQEYRDRNNRDRNDWQRDGWQRDSRNYSSSRDDHRRWNNDWRRDSRYDWNRYRSANRGIYRMPRYYAPYRGYNYSRLSIGIFLNSGFYGRNYWISDPWSYRLPPAYGPYRWIRYYDDVLLIDTYSGEVVDVIYDFFW